METKQKIIIVGGGFAGLQFARHLDPKYFEAILIDQVNHHQFQPLFYQVASARIEPSSISFPFRKIFQHKDHVQIRLAKVQEVDAEKKIVKTTIGDFNYDILVLATGCVTNYFGLKLPESGVYSLKTTYEAIQIRNNIIRNFENI
ncbi:MAG TPA: FAD-dependent oxidoreductase, partial [Niabella sp.]|nr:FAD-dependent oxidoreductase [Niabella sp.]